MKEYKIGRYPEADIVLTMSYCSRDHAKLMVTDTGKLLLQDTSSNGTIINGVKTHQQTTEIKYGDEILFAGIEKLDWSLIEKPNVHTAMPTPEKLKEENNKGISSPILKSSSLIKIVLAIIGISTLVAFSYTFFHKSEEKPLDPSAIYSQYKNTVALVEVRYYVRVKTAANELFFGLNADCEIAPSMDKSTLQPLKSEGTAFFYDGLGMLVTNRHVIQPWKNEALSEYFYKRIRPAIKKALISKGWGNEEPTFTGEIESIHVYPNGYHYSESGGIKCTILKSSTNDDIDLATLQTVNQTIPAGAAYITASQIELRSEKTNVNTAAYIIGFPMGEALALDEEKTINCTSTQGSFTQEPTKYYIQYSAATAGGASGSPVFNQYGKLVAINYLGSKEQSFNRGILISHLIDLE